MADNQTIIIKKIKKGGHGHHGGAWKVAYADFVTAMMAFFLLLWLLSSTSKATKDGIAEYFTPTVGLKDEKGIGVAGGESPLQDGKSKSEMMPPGMVPGQVEQGPTPDVPKPSPIDGEKDAKLFGKAEEELKQAMESDPNLREFSQNLLMEQTPEGLKLELRDDERNPMFLPGSTQLSEAGQKLLASIAPIVSKLPNLLSIVGHTDSTPLGRADYSNWELSADRANSARRFLISIGVSEKQMGKVVGRADQELLLPEVPDSPRNRRLEIILLKGSHMKLQPHQMIAPRGALSTAPRASEAIQLMQQKKIEQTAPVVPAEKKPAEPVDPASVPMPMMPLKPIQMQPAPTSSGTMAPSNLPDAQDTLRSMQQKLQQQKQNGE